MRRAIHLARTHRIILVMILATVGGLVGACGIKVRSSFLPIEISTEKIGEMPSGNPIVIYFPASAIPGSWSYGSKIIADRGKNAETEWKDADPKPGLTPGNSNSPGNGRGLHFSGLEALPPKPQVWEEDFSARVEQAKANTKPKMLQGKYIDINLSAQILSVFEDGKLLDSYLISTGKSGMETPRGTHTIANKCPRAWSREYGLFMPYWMAIDPGGSFGIHELPESPDRHKDGANDLGIPVSHGCVRLGIGPAERVYNWAEIGTPVVVY